MLDPKKIWKRIKQEEVDEIFLRNRGGWSRFELVTAFKWRLMRDAGASYNDFMAEIGLPESARYAETEGHNIVLWHATYARHIDNILEHGFFHHGGAFFAPPTFGLPFGLAAAIAHDDKKDPQDLVVFACLFDLEGIREGEHYEARRQEYRFFARVSPESVIAVLNREGVEVIGETVRSGGEVTPVDFVHRGKGWTIASRNPYHFGEGRFFSTPEEWLDCYLDYLFARHDGLTILEIVNGVYMNLSPMEALPFEQVIETICRRCRYTGIRGPHICLRLEE